MGKIRRACLLLSGCLAALTTTGAFAASYRSGTYRSGAQAGTSVPGLRFVVSGGLLTVARISYKESCAAGRSPGARDEFNFISGQGAFLKAKIDAQGRFSARFHSHAGTVRISGLLHGNSATVASSESNTFAPTGGRAAYACEGRHTFQARR